MSEEAQIRGGGSMATVSLKRDVATVSLEVELFRMTNGLMRIGVVILGIFSLWGLVLTPFYDPELFVHVLGGLVMFATLVFSNETLLPWWQKRLRARYNV